jgi:uncharacterized protein
MDVTRRIVTLRNSHGHALHCMLDEPAGGAAGTGFAAVLLCPGIKTRLGPHRLYRKLAQFFVARGIPVLRVDFHGLGDSEGELPENRLDAYYDQVQFGRHVDDVRSALDWLESECGIQRCIVGGLCGGALTGLLAASDPRVAAVYALGLPVALEARAAATGEHMTRGELVSKRVVYLRKALRPKSWLRLLSLQSDYKLIWRMLRSALRRRAGRHTPSAQLAHVPPPASSPAEDLNPKFPPAFFGFLASGRPALVIFSERDRLRWHFEEKFAQPWAHALEAYKSQLSIVVIPDADHILGSPESVAEVGRQTAAWLDACFPVSSASPVARGVDSFAAPANPMRIATA